YYRTPPNKVFGIDVVHPELPVQGPDVKHVLALWIRDRSVLHGTLGLGKKTASMSDADFAAATGSLVKNFGFRNFTDFKPGPLVNMLDRGDLRVEIGPFQFVLDNMYGGRGQLKLKNEKVDFSTKLDIDVERLAGRELDVQRDA